MVKRKYNLVVMGATGFTGKLVVEYLLNNYGVDNKEFSWAIAGRNKRKIELLKRSLEDISPKAKDIPEFIADSNNIESLNKMTSKCDVVISTVGPYLKYGHLLVESCANNGTHYCDLTGEAPFIKESIDKFHNLAKANNCKIIHSCGFDSIPSDIGVLLLQNAFISEFGEPCDEIKLYVRGMRGGFSGGTIESIINIYDYVAMKPKLNSSLKNPFSLAPDFDYQDSPQDPSLKTLKWDANINQWICPFAMSGINTKIVRRSNGLMNHPYGHKFKYSEVVSFPRGIKGFISGLMMTMGLGFLKISIHFKPVLYILRKFYLPSPGEGPSRSERENGFFKLKLTGYRNGVHMKSLVVNGDSDAGYSGTAKMITESALSIILNNDEIPNNYGVLTPASAIGEIIEKRLSENGITYKIV